MKLYLFRERERERERVVLRKVIESIRERERTRKKMKLTNDRYYYYWAVLDGHRLAVEKWRAYYDWPSTIIIYILFITSKKFTMTNGHWP